MPFFEKNVEKEIKKKLRFNRVSQILSRYNSYNYQGNVSIFSEVVAV